MFEYNWGKEGPFTAQQNEMGGSCYPHHRSWDPTPCASRGCVLWMVAWHLDSTKAWKLHNFLSPRFTQMEQAGGGRKTSLVRFIHKVYRCGCGIPGILSSIWVSGIYLRDLVCLSHLMWNGI